MKTIEFYLLKRKRFTLDYIKENIVTYGELRCKDWNTGEIYELVDLLEKNVKYRKNIV